MRTRKAEKPTTVSGIEEGESMAQAAKRPTLAPATGMRATDNRSSLAVQRDDAMNREHHFELAQAGPRPTFQRTSYCLLSAQSSTSSAVRCDPS
jgi:hypothetical protein